jgi:hypothetical protein
MIPCWVHGADTAADLALVHLWNEMLHLQTTGGTEAMDRHLQNICRDLCGASEPG